jgi:NTP pyrophosphatase (non-canonical NTP hydrolase)
MEIERYQEYARDTAVYPMQTAKAALSYSALGLAGEAGEIANKFKKILRGDKSVDAAREELVAELGDVLWYVANMASDLGVSLDKVAIYNLNKLQSRKARGAIKGSGDNR